MAISFERSFDFALIGDVLRHPKIYPNISDDYSPPREEFQPAQHYSIWYVVARDVFEGGSDLLGLWMFHPHNRVCWEVHTALMPCAWGERGLAAARQLPAWIWARTECRRIVTNVPENNRLALYFAQKAGMHAYGVNVASFMKDGKLLDQTCLGISMPEEVAVADVQDGLESIFGGSVDPEGGGVECLLQPL